MKTQTTTTRIKPLAAALAVAMTTGSASAAVTITALEVGNDVVLSASGSMDLSAASFAGDFAGVPAFVAPAEPRVYAGASDPITLYALPGFTGPGSFGPGGFTSATSQSGDTCGLAVDLQIAYLPMGYLSGNPLSSTATFENHTFASLGMTEGTYVWTWNTATGTDSLTLEIIQQLVTNVTQSTMHTTLQDALDNANSGDAIEIAAGTLFEDNIVFPIGLNVTITGAGMDQTFIDGSGGLNDDPVLAINSVPAVTISDLAVVNGTRTMATGGGAAVIIGSAAFSRVAFRDNIGNSAAGQLFIQTAEGVSFDRCEFTGGTGRAAVTVNTPGSAPGIDFRQCLFTDLPTAFAFDGPIRFVGCTMDPQGNAFDVQFATVVALTNCVIDGAAGTSGAITASHSLYSGAPAGSGNIDGAPTFVDAAGGDYRLAPGSLGIDAADFDAYAAAGGGFFDLAGADRIVDDLATVDTGTGAFAFLDMGAYESPAQAASCPGDVTGDNMVDIADLNILLFNFGNTCP